MSSGKRKEICNTTITSQQEVVLDQRMKKYSNGQTNFSSWMAVKKRIKAMKVL